MNQYTFKETRKDILKDEPPKNPETEIPEQKNKKQFFRRISKNFNNINLQPLLKNKCT